MEVMRTKGTDTEAIKKITPPIACRHHPRCDGEGVYVDRVKCLHQIR